MGNSLLSSSSLRSKAVTSMAHGFLLLRWWSSVSSSVSLRPGLLAAADLHARGRLAVGSIPISSTTLLNRGDDHRHAFAA